VTDPGVVAAGLVERVQKALGSKFVGIYDKCIQDSGVHVINEASKLAKEAGADCLVSVGGGSTIDTAKGMAVLLKEGGNLEDYAGFQLLSRPQTPHIVVPTTAGTGSEATMTAVVKDWDRHQKMLFSDTNMIPNVGILDPTIVEGLPKELTATTGMDAFTHGVEAIHTLQAEPAEVRRGRPRPARARAAAVRGDHGGNRVRQRPGGIAARARPLPGRAL
jgi:alcohol dehydrogenase